MKVARCDNVSEPDGVTCSGLLFFWPADLQAACNVCGAWCGSQVATYLCPETRVREGGATLVCVKPLYRAKTGELWDYHAGGHFFTTADNARRLREGDYDAKKVLSELRTIPKVDS